MADLRRLHPRLTETDLEATPFVPELSPVVDPRGGSVMTRPWLDWARRLTLLVGVKHTDGGGGGGESDPTHVVGPDGATPDAIAVYSGSTGKTIKDSLTSIGSVINQAVNAAIAAILPGGILPVSKLPVHHLTHQPGGSDPMAVDAAAVTGSLRTLGTGANQAAPGNDARFTAPSTPTAHATTHSGGGTDPVTVTNLSGYPGGTTNFLRADGTFATPPAGVPGAHHATHEPGGGDALVNAAWTNQANIFTQSQFESVAGGAALGLQNPAATPGERAWMLGTAGPQLYLSTNTDNWVGQTGIPLTVARNGDTTVAGKLLGAANVARRDAVNTFTEDQTVQKAGPRVGWVDTAAPANSRVFAVFASGQQWTVAGYDDAITAPSGACGMSRTGDWLVGGNLTEKNRATPLGHWIDVPFSAANFTALAPMTWTVGAGAIGVNRFALVGKTLFWRCAITASVLGGSASGELRLVLPAGLVANGAGNGVSRVHNAGWKVAAAAWVDGGTVVTLTNVDFSNYVVPDAVGYYLMVNLTIEVR